MYNNIPLHKHTVASKNKSSSLLKLLCPTGSIMILVLLHHLIVHYGMQ